MAKPPKKPRFKLPKFGRKTTVTCSSAGWCACKASAYAEKCAGCYGGHKHCGRHKKGCHKTCKP